MLDSLTTGYHQLLLNKNYPIRFRHVDLRLDKVVFADGTVWYKSYYFHRDPNNPQRYIRDKHFQKGAKQENLRPGTLLRQAKSGPATLASKKLHAKLSQLLRDRSLPLRYSAQTRS